MSQIETIVSTVRPIKKLSIIEGDLSIFFKIVTDYSEELGGFYNLILLNDDSLFSENTIEFVNEHDPDLIINYSKCENEKLTKIFKTKVLDGKDQNFRYVTIETPLGIFDNIPENARSFFKEIQTMEVNFLAGDSYLHHFLALNFGILTEKYQVDWEDNDFFEPLKIKQINPGIENLHAFSLLLNHEHTPLTISNALSRVTISYGIWTKNHNKENFFHLGPTLIIGSNKIQDYIYFWNVRATYPHSDNIWIPIEMFDDNFQTYLLKNFKHYCLLTTERAEEIRSAFRTKNSSCTEINGSKYYFHTIRNGWKSFEFIQNCVNDSGKVRIIHPQTKLFSKLGYNINLAIEIAGLECSYLPKSLELGKLFNQYPQPEPQHFMRMSSRGLTRNFTEFGYLDESSFFTEINIPNSEDIFSTLFNEKGITLKATKKTQAINQVISLLKGLENINLLTDSLIFDLIVKLSPKRIKRLGEEIAKNVKSQLSGEEIEQILIRSIGDVTTIYSQIFIQVSQIDSLLGVRLKDNRNFFAKIQKLYDLNILLRGKKIVCPYCKQILWYPLSKLNDSLTCYCCNNTLSLPICDDNKVEEDSLRLNELLINVTDQGELPVLLTLNLLNQQKVVSKKFLFDYEYFDDEKKLIGELDIIFNFGKMLGLAEVKADRGFEKKQIENLLKISERVEAGLLIFSTLKEKNSDEVLSLIEILKQNNLSIPAFIFTKEILFSQTPRDFSKYFEIHGECFPTGPIIVD